MSDARVLRSCDSRGQYHQWLLLAGDAPVRCLSRSEHGFIRSHLRGTGKREKVYLVVGFPGEPGRIVALPARAALKAGRIYSHRAGIAWDS